MKKLESADGDVVAFAGGNTKALIKQELLSGNIIDKPSIIVKSRGNIDFEYCDTLFTHKNELWSYSLNADNINLKYIYYYLKNNVEYFRIKAKSGKLPQISTPDTDKYKICLPTIERQKEIADRIESFEKLTGDISSGLPAEISARHKQYEYYRNKLLTFSAKNSLSAVI